MIDIKVLEKALAPIGSLGKGELSFTVGDVPVTLRVLTADEDILVQQYARASDDGGEVEGLTLMERYKRATLAYAIVAVGPFDLRAEDTVLTGETTSTGAPVRMPRHVAVRKIIDGWTRVATMALFQKYLELINRVDAEAERAVHFNPQDLNAEVERVERRLADLKKEQERTKFVGQAGNPAILGEADRAAQERLRGFAETAAGKAPTKGTKAGQEVSVPVVPTPLASPARARVAPPVTAPPIPPPPSLPPPQPHEPAPDMFEEMRDSMGDSPEALAMETARLIQMRQAARRASLDAAQQGVAEAEHHVRPRRQPPHLDAAHVARTVVEGDVFESSRPAPNLDGTETYRLGSVPLSNLPRPKVRSDMRIPVNEKPKDDPTNPRFRPPRR